MLLSLGTLDIVGRLPSAIQPEADARRMNSIAACIHSAGWFLRRRDLLRLGYSDENVRDALACHSIFRVRQGWYSLPDAPDSAIEAVRVGGRLTSTSALESYGLPVPRTPQLHIAVPETASRLRTAHDRFALLAGDVSICIHWNDVSRRGQDSWRVSLDDALLAAICEQPKFVAIACASAVARRKGWSRARMDAVFARAPERVRAWRPLVSWLDDSHGETFLRLEFDRVGIDYEQQARVRGVGLLDFRVGVHTYVEVDGAQHDLNWIGETPSSWEHYLDRDTSMAITSKYVLHFSYRQLYSDLPRVIAAISQRIADDAALDQRRKRHPFRSRSTSPHLAALRKRRRIAAIRAREARFAR